MKELEIDDTPDMPKGFEAYQGQTLKEFHSNVITPTFTKAMRDGGWELSAKAKSTLFSGNKHTVKKSRHFF